jgi:6-phosphofructokinase 1
MVIEVMGRYAGWIALRAGLGGGADIILIPEIPFTWEAVFTKVLDRSRRGKRFSIVCVAEGARLPEGGEVVKSYDTKRTDSKQLGGIGERVAQRITEGTGLETRVSVLGHLLRGGSPVPSDRVLATRFGVLAGHLAARGRYGLMAALHGNVVEPVPIVDAIVGLKLVSRDDELVKVAKSVGTIFGEG